MPKKVSRFNISYVIRDTSLDMLTDLRKTFLRAYLRYSKKESALSGVATGGMRANAPTFCQDGAWDFFKIDEK